VRKPQNLIAGAALTLVIAFLALLLPVATLHDATVLADRARSGPGGHGCKEGNLIPNCGMDNFVPIPQGAASGMAPAGWTPFVVSGGLAMDPSPDTYWGAPSLRMWSDGGIFVAGIWTQVGGLTPGATYYASMGWGGPTEPDAFGRRLGIDPTGGTDPNSPNIVWGPMLRGPGKVLNDSNPGYPNIDVSAVAKGSTATVFVWVDHNYSTGQNQIFIDAVGLYQSDAPVAPPPTSTSPLPPPASPTAAAPAAAPTRVPATATAAALPPTETATPAATDTPAPTATPTMTAAPTQTATPTQTLTPSVTPSSTLPPRPRATISAASRGSEVEVSSATAPPRVLLFGGIGALACAGLLGVFVAVRRRP
jgi:hypothetical protein